MARLANGLLAPTILRDLTDDEKAAVEAALVEPLRVIELHNLGTLCPSQWEAYEADTMRPVYIRYRHGRLTVERFTHTIGITGDPEATGDPTLIYSKRVGDGLNGVMTTDEMLAHTGIIAS